MPVSLCSPLTLSLGPQSSVPHSLSADTNCQCNTSQSSKDDQLTKQQYSAIGKTDSGKPILLFLSGSTTCISLFVLLCSEGGKNAT